MNYCAIATGNRPILIRCALQHARRYNVTNLPKTDANTLYFSARAANGRPYVRNRNSPININLPFKS